MKTRKAMGVRGQQRELAVKPTTGIVHIVHSLVSQPNSKVEARKTMQGLRQQVTQILLRIHLICSLRACGPGTWFGISTNLKRTLCAYQSGVGASGSPYCAPFSFTTAFFHRYVKGRFNPLLSPEAQEVCRLVPVTVQVVNWEACGRQSGNMVIVCVASTGFDGVLPDAAQQQRIKRFTNNHSVAPESDSARAGPCLRDCRPWPPFGQVLSSLLFNIGSCTPYVSE